MPNELRNIGASVRARLLNIAKERNQPFDLLLTRYVLERLLYRLGSTKHRERFALKGAMLLTTWIDDPFRPTRDLDLLGFGNPDPDALLKVSRRFALLRLQTRSYSIFPILPLIAPVMKPNTVAFASKATQRSTARASESSSTLLSAMRLSRALKRPTCRSCSIFPHLASAPIHAKRWSPKKSRP